MLSLLCAIQQLREKWKFKSKKKLVQKREKKNRWMDEKNVHLSLTIHWISNVCGLYYKLNSLYIFVICFSFHSNPRIFKLYKSSDEETIKHIRVRVAGFWGFSLLFCFWSGFRFCRVLVVLFSFLVSLVMPFSFWCDYFFPSFSCCLGCGAGLEGLSRGLFLGSFGSVFWRLF